MRTTRLEALVVLDVDGTLLDTAALDGRVLARTFEDAFGAPLPSADWSVYLHATDRGVAAEAIARVGADARRLPELQARFLAALRGALAAAGAREIAGASRALGALQDAGHGVAIATGAWEGAARLKLTAARVDVRGLPLVGCDAQPARAEIVREAVRRVGTPGVRFVFVGDGSWDIRTARTLGIPFVGIDPAGSGALRRAGARCVLADFADVGRVLAAVANAPVP